MKSGSTFDNIVPGYGLGPIVSVTLAPLINSSVTNESVAAFSGSTYYNRTTFYIAANDIEDLTSSVGETGQLTVTPPETSTGEYLLLTSYYKTSLARSCIAGTSAPQNLLQNGSFAVDRKSKLFVKTQPTNTSSLQRKAQEDTAR